MAAGLGVADMSRTVELKMQTVCAPDLGVGCVIRWLVCLCWKCTIRCWTNPWLRHRNNKVSAWLVNTCLLATYRADPANSE